VIVPCYNQGRFVDDAIESVLAQTYTNFEIVIVNDGSTEEETNRILQNYRRPKTTVLHTANRGRSAARNHGIRAATGQYILPLDADDRLGSEYLEQAVNVLEAQDNVGIVYCEAEFFGARSGRWELPPYKFPDILLGNVIFVSGMFRRVDWEKTGGYRTNLSIWEDFDFWLSIIELGRDVCRIPKVLFYYRQHAGSTIATTSNDQLAGPYGQIMRYHQQLYADHIEFIAEQLLTLRHRVGYLEDVVRSMKRSRFWRLRERCLRLVKPFRRRATE